MAIETQYNIVKVNELRPIKTAMGNDEIIINDVDSFPLETKKITAENFAKSIKDYILPIAGEGPNGVLGGVRIGDGLTINPINGLLSNDILSLGDLDDVIILNPEAGHVLRHNGVQWINQPDGGFTNIIAGEGLSGGGTEGEITIDVNAGRGLSIVNDAVTVNVNAGLEIVNDHINVRLNNGLTFTDNKITIVAGDGLVISDGSLKFNPGLGLVTSGQKINVDIGTGLTFNGNKLELNNIGDLKDVTINNPQIPESIVYVGNSRWENRNASSDWQETNSASPRYIHNKPQLPINGDLGDNGSITITTDTSPIYCAPASFMLVAEANPTNGNGDAIIGIFEFTWQKSSNGGSDWVDLSFNRATDISYQRKTEIEINEHNPTDIYRLHVRFEDLYAKEVIGVSENIAPVAGSTASVTSQIQHLDLSTETTGSFVVKVDAPNPQFCWHVNGVLITGPNTPDIGYTFVGYNTDTLQVTRDDSKAITVGIQAVIINDSYCTPELYSDLVLLEGPGGGNNTSTSSRSGQTIITVGTDPFTYGNDCKRIGTVTANTAEYTTTIIGAQGGGCYQFGEYAPWTCYCTYTYSTYYK